MLKLNNNDITLTQSAANKIEAIKNIAKSLTDNGFVESGYVEGMLNRENQNSTFLGNAIAIPHGTVDTRDMVKKTGVVVHHFPHGVDWGDGNKAYVAIGIAAKSDEHLSILKQLTNVLSADGIENRLREAKTAEDIISLLHGDIQLEVDFDASLIQLGFPATDMLQISAIAGGLLKRFGSAENEFVADIVTKKPTHLGQGLWLVSSDKKVNRTAISFVSTAHDFEYQGEKVKALLVIAACNDSHQCVIKNLADIILNNEQEKLLHANAEQIVSLLKDNNQIGLATDEANLAVFTIKNAHGLHARPSAMLVATAKKFASSILVANLDGNGKAVCAKNLMKVVGLGAKKGHNLQFTVDGVDAQAALEAIEKAIASGLGEGGL